MCRIPLTRAGIERCAKQISHELVFLAYINGHQDYLRLVGAEPFVLADKAGLLRDPDLVAERMRRVLFVAGVA